MSDLPEFDLSEPVDPTKNRTKRRKAQRTLEEALAGKPARVYRVNRSEEPVIDPATGKQTHAPGFITGKRKVKEGGGWFRWATDPTHPKYTPELAKKHYLMIQQNGRKGAATRRSTPKGYRAKDWKPIFAARLEEGRKIVEELEYAGLLSLPTEDIDRIGAKEAMAFNVAVLRSPEMSIENRMKAAKTVLEFAKSKPVARSEVQLNAAEQFLSAVADEIGLK